MAVADFYEDFTLIETAHQPDGMGGTITNVESFTSFRAGIYTNSSTEAVVAYQRGAKTIATIVTGLETELEVGDIVRRERDNTLYRVFADAQTAPDMAVMAKIRTVQAEVLQA